MVQLGQVTGYDAIMDEEHGSEPEPEWADSLDGAIREFVASISETADRLTAAAEHFAAASLRTLEEVAAKAGASAAAAARSATEAQRLTDSLGQAVAEAGERLRSEAWQAVEDGSRKAEESLAASREAAAAAEHAAEQASASATEAAALTTQAITSVQEQAVATNAQEVLDRLEADYQLLAQLVQELQGRLATLSVAAPAPEVAALEAPEQPYTAAPPVTTYSPRAAEPEYAPRAPEAMPSDLTAAEPTNVSWQGIEAEPEQAGAVEPVWQPPSEGPPAEEPPEAAWALAAEASMAPAPAAAQPVALDGKVILNVSPIPDFDRLLSLDGALGRLSCVRNVTLADYSEEEVTFRVELLGPVSADEFVRELSMVANLTLAVAAATGGSLQLKADTKRS